MPVHDSVESLIDSLRIPTLPSSLLKLRELLASEDTGLADVAQLIATDPPIAATVLRIANSAQFGLRDKTLSVQRAATVLGMRTISTIAMRAGIVSVFSHLEDTPGFSLDNFWRHAILTAHTASVLAARTRRRSSDLSPQDYYTCGLLHDMGQLVMYDTFGDDYAHTLLECPTIEEQSVREEARFLGLNHGDVGSLSASMWALPEPIPDLIRFHHKPQQCRSARDVALLIACASELAERVSEAPNSTASSIASSVRSLLPGSSPEILVAVAGEAIKCWSTIEV